MIKSQYLCQLNISINSKPDWNFIYFLYLLHENGFMALNTSFLSQYVLGVNHLEIKMSSKIWPLKKIHYHMDPIIEHYGYTID